MAKKSVVLVVSYHVVDQDEINLKARELKDKGAISEIFNIPIPGLEKATIKDTHICDVRMPEDRERFVEIIYNDACAAVMGEPEKIYIIKKP